MNDFINDVRLASESRDSRVPAIRDLVIKVNDFLIAEARRQNHGIDVIMATYLTCLLMSMEALEEIAGTATLEGLRRPLELLWSKLPPTPSQKQS